MSETVTPEFLVGQQTHTREEIAGTDADHAALRTIVSNPSTPP